MTDLEIRRRLRSALVGTAYHDDRIKIANLLTPFVENIIRERFAEQAIVKRCSECGAAMDPTKTWCWTAYGAVDTENCARLLVDRMALLEQR